VMTVETRANLVKALAGLHERDEAQA